LVSGVFALLVWRTSALRFADAHARLSEVAGPMMTLASAREEVLASGISDRFLDELDAGVLRWVDASAKADRLVSVGGRVPAIAVACFLAAATIIKRGGIAGVRLDELAPLGAFVCVLRPLVGLMRGSFEFSRLRPKLEALIAYVEPASRSNGSRSPVPSRPSVIRWLGVSFAYTSEARPPANVIDGLDAEWPSGALTVLGGPNGSGKSTLLRLLLGIVSPTRGEIRIDDTPLDDVDVDEWRRTVAYVPQRPYFPERALIRDALAFGGLQLTDEAAERALEDVGVLEPLRRASATAPLDVRVDSLSAGQRQRVALTRAFREDARVVILDEPDANLDAAGVAMLCRRLVELARSRIVVVAAHSVELARIAGNTVRLDRGGVASTLDGE
jgi:ABC-type bacteriocin/lantibiotic exporter with double-glycine peptidase domain